MQTRRDQLQAYRFQNRRALAALVTGQPNVVEPPMRRLTVTTISGIMIAVLIAVGFALFGLIRPTASSSWRSPGAVIVENDTGARYVFVNNVLHPALNYSSAVLAAGGSAGQPPSVVHVDRSQLTGVRRGTAIGIPGLPDSVPSASQLVTSPWAVCSRLVPAPGTSTVRAAATLVAGGNAGARRLPAGDGVVVQGVGSTAEYLLADGQRFTVGSEAVAAILGLQNAAPLQVSHAFLDAVPEGPVLRAPRVLDAGHPFKNPIDGQQVRVGQLLQTGSDTYYLVLRDGVAAVSPLEAALLQTLSVGGKTLAPVHTTTSAALDAGTSTKQWPDEVQPELAGIPSRLPPLPAAPADNGGLCAQYRPGTTQPQFAVPAGRLPGVAPSGYTESARSAAGKVDDVVLPAGAGALVRSMNGSHTVYLVAYPGEKFAAASSGVLSAFGFGGVHPVALPPQLIALLPSGPALDPQAARRATTG